MYRKGTTLIWQFEQPEETKPVDQLNADKLDSGPPIKKQIKSEILVLNIDIIGEQFWREHSYILS